MLDGVLLGPHGNEWKKEPRQLPEAYEEWIDAQLFSKDASDRWPTFADLIYPLDKTSKKSTLDVMWARIKQVSSRTRATIRAMLMFRQNYKDVSGKVPDELWNVADIRRIKPSWHGPAKSRPGDDDDTIIRPAARAKSGKNRPMEITNGDDSDNGSMPSLQTVSDSSEEDEYADDDDLDGDDESDGDSDEDYDTDEEDELRDLMREAMDTAVASSDFYNIKGPAPDFDALAEERKGNPFLKLLGSLRGAFTHISSF